MVSSSIQAQGSLIYYESEYTVYMSVLSSNINREWKTQQRHQFPALAIAVSVCQLNCWLF